MSKILDMRHYRLQTVAVLLTSTLLAPGCQAPPERRAVTPSRPAIVRDEKNHASWTEKLVDLHNREREKRGLPPLEIDPKLQAAAEEHAQDMARRKRMSHRGSDWSSPFDRMKKAGYVYQSASENVAYGQESPEEAITSWMHSPPHRHAILGNFSRIGAACATASDGRNAWCVTFGAPRDE